VPYVTSTIPILSCYVCIYFIKIVSQSILRQLKNALYVDKKAYSSELIVEHAINTLFFQVETSC
jgi:hypothetical protein